MIVFRWMMMLITHTHTRIQGVGYTKSEVSEVVERERQTLSYSTRVECGHRARSPLLYFRDKEKIFRISELRTPFYELRKNTKTLLLRK